MQMGLMVAVLVALLAHHSTAQSTSGCTTALMTLNLAAAVPLPAAQRRRVVARVQHQSDPRTGSPRHLQREDATSLCKAPSPSSPPTTSPPANSSDNTPVTPAASSTPTIPSGSKAMPAATGASGSIKASFGSLAFALLLASFGSSLLKS
ncbi:hypothetical protein NL676_002679 [Syzygium grande]|nr:hypothetical protein NL676_002679 [Syzygium grande]